MIFASDPERRKYSPVEIFVNTTHRGDGRFDERNGCSTRIDRFNGALQCGYPGRVSKTTWKILSSSEKGDVYKMTREYPSDSDAPAVETKETTYAGKPLTLWEDDHHKIIPRPEEKKGSGADSAFNRVRTEPRSFLHEARGESLNPKDRRERPSSGGVGLARQSETPGLDPTVV